MSRIDALWLNFNLMLLLVHSSDSFDFRLQLRIAPVQPTLLVRLGSNIARQSLLVLGILLALGPFT